MAKYIVKRLLLMVFVFFVIMAICFTLIRLLPLPDVAKYGPQAELIQARREKMGYGKPIVIQFFLYWKNVLLRGDWGIGEEYKTGLDVGQVFIERLPATLLVNFSSILVSIPLGIALGIFAISPKAFLTVKRKKSSSYLAP